MAAPPAHTEGMACSRAGVSPRCCSSPRSAAASRGGKSPATQQDGATGQQDGPLSQRDGATGDAPAGDATGKQDVGQQDLGQIDGRSCSAGTGVCVSDGFLNGCPPTYQPSEAHQDACGMGGNEMCMPGTTCPLGWTPADGVSCEAGRICCNTVC